MEAVIGASHGFNLKAKRDLHPNIWSHDFIQSLSSPFLEPHYESCTKTLIKDVNMYLQQIFQECKESQDVNKLLCTIDELMCLGVDRHFEEQIKQSLDLLHHIWKSQNGGIAHNLSSAALAFTLLRLNRFPNISSGYLLAECFGKLKNENGESFLPDKEEYSSEEVISVLNLLRASQIQFTGETTLQEAERYATSFLKSWLKSQKNPCSFMHLINKVKYCLEYPWISNTPRWEARNFIDFHESDEKWMGVKENAMIMQLAKLDYNSVQACHQNELKLISKWWMESPISKTGDLRERPTEAYFVASCIFHQPEFEVARITMAKLIKSVYLLDDLYDACATLEHIPSITNAVERFDASVMQTNNEFIRTILKFILDSISETIEQCNEIQKQDTGKYIRYRWEQLVKSYEVEIGWNNGHSSCTFAEYMKNGKQSAGVWPGFLTAKLLACKGYPLNVLESREQGMSKLEIACGEASRLIDDIHDFEDEKKHGDVVSAISCYMDENPHLTTEEALEQLRLKHRELIKEVAKLYLSSNEDAVEDDPLQFKRAVFETTRAVHFMFTHGDGFTVSDGKVRDQINAALIEHLQVDSPAPL